MSKLVRYAGYDPSETTLAGEFEHRPIFNVDWCDYVTRDAPRRVPVDRALQLRRSGLRWRVVTEVLNCECGRNFTTDAVRAACIKEKRG